MNSSLALSLQILKLVKEVEEENHVEIVSSVKELIEDPSNLHILRNRIGCSSLPRTKKKSKLHELCALIGKYEQVYNADIADLVNNAVKQYDKNISSIVQTYLSD
jgi:hypothetical protein